MGSDFETRDSGLVVPKEPQPPRLYGPLELQDSDERRRAQGHIQSLLNLTSFQDHGVMADSSSSTRRRLLLALARELMGVNFDYEELC